MDPPATRIFTPARIVAKELLPHLPNGHQVVLAGFGHTETFWNYQTKAGSRLINTFFDSGRIDLALPAGEGRLHPAVTFAAIAKLIACSMAGLALLAVVSLLWMARRVHKRGRFGPKASAALRAAYPLVLGLGGWSLGALIVLTAMPGDLLGDELLAAISAGVPAGLGIYLAWVKRDWSATTKTTGFAAAAGGALVGAWLGFHATTGLLALITAVAAAAAGTNLLLLALDISWDRQARSRFTDTSAKQTLEAHLATG